MIYVQQIVVADSFSATNVTWHTFVQISNSHDHKMQVTALSYQVRLHTWHMPVDSLLWKMR